MDYGIIFIIIIVIIIIIAIILIIYANRNNTQNLLLTLPNYRIQHLLSDSYLSLTNIPNVNDEFISSGEYPIYTLSSLPIIPFWSVLVSAGFNNTDSMGLWKINIIKQISVNEAEIEIINDVYFNESPGLSLGYLINTLPLESGGPFTQTFSPTGTVKNFSTFIMTTTAVNTFTLHVFNSNGVKLPVIIDNNTNFLIKRENTKNKPDVFKLQLI